MKAFKSGAETYAKVICLCDETRHEAVAVTEPTITDTVHSSVVERLTADQQVPGSILDGDHGLPS